MARSLGAKIENRSALVGIVGLGYVGLPLAQTFAEGASASSASTSTRPRSTRSTRGATTSSTSTAPGSSAAIDGRPLRGDRRLPRLARGRRDRDLRADAADDAARARPVLRRRTRSGRSGPRAAAGPARRARIHHLPRHDRRARAADPRGVRPALRPRLLPRLQPEREDPGNAKYTTAHDPEGRRRHRRAVAATSPQALYEPVIERDRARVSAARRRGGKILENIYRAVNIALVNELKIVFDRMGIDVWEVIDAAKTKPFGFRRFYPGPAWAATASRSTPSTSPGRPASTASRRVHRAGRRGQRRRCRAYVDRASSTLALNERGQGGSRAAGSSSSGSPTRRTSTTRARARPSRSSRLSAARRRGHATTTRTCRRPRDALLAGPPPMTSSPLTAEVLEARRTPW